ncbi:MAG: hypothetical protein K9W44_03725 [Candidatus Lokiarchaeota archaeon]|nr:hypothetical protein [Candidatus Harpocratesius repetitus]
MIHLAKSGNRFDLYYQDVKFFSHRNDEPAVILGIGDHKIKVQDGNFKFKEKLQRKIPLNRFNIEMNTKTRVDIQFSNTETYESVVLSFRAGKELEIQINAKSQNINRIWVHLPCHDSEFIYGSGIHASNFCLNEKKVQLWVQNIRSRKKQKKGSLMQSSFPLPIFIGIAESVKYYCYIETYNFGELRFHQKGKKGNFHELYFWGIPSKIFIRKGENPIQVLEYLTDKLGKQPHLPEWIYEGIWIADSGKNGNEKIESRLKRIIEAGVKIGAIWLSDWSGIQKINEGAGIFWDWKWNGSGRPIKYSDFPEFVKNLKNIGIHVIGYINGLLSRKGDLYQDIPDKSFLIHTHYDTEYMISVGDQQAVMLNLFNPACFNWFKKIIKNNLIKEAGLDAWLVDYGERLPIDIETWNEKKGFEMHNKYPVFLSQVNYEAIFDVTKNLDTTFISSTGYLNSIRYTPIFQIGFLFPSWDRDKGIGAVVSSMLSAGMSGIGQTFSDIGGVIPADGDIKRFKELIMRWAELACFSLLMVSNDGYFAYTINNDSKDERYDPSSQFNSDDEILKHFARMSQIHSFIKPYLQKCEEEYQNKGIPIIRAPILYFFDDPRVRTIDDQYLLGPDVWVAPIVKERTTQKSLYLPDDGWIHLWSGIEFKQGSIKINVPIGYPAVFYKKNSDWKDLFDSITTQFGTHV